MNAEPTAHALRSRYRLPLWSMPDPRMRRSFAFSASLGAAVLAIVLLAPVRVAPPPRVEEVPERLAKLILKQRKAPPVLAPSTAHIEAPKPAPVEEVKEPEPPRVEPRPDARVEPTPPPRRVREEPKLAQDRGTAGRAQAESEVAALETTTRSIEATLGDLASDLGAVRGVDPSKTPPRRRASGRPGGGRSTAEVGGAVAARTDLGSGAGAGTVVTGDLIDIEALVPGRGDGAGDLASADPGTVAGGVAGSYRSNASLLAIVRKYAAGIQFCYDNQLKRDPGLEGKMVVVLTVLASGRVAEAGVDQDTLGSAPLRECVMAQVREWIFPAIPEGTVTFRAPFVFTPPS